MKALAREAIKIKKHLKAFTLMELLVVIGVMIILAAALLPALAGSRKRARQISCTNNLRQLALGNSSYHEDYGCFAPAASENSFGGFSYSAIEGSAKRWYGELDSATGEYDRLKSPLYEFLGKDTDVIDCPGFLSDSKKQESGGIGYSLFIGTKNRPGDGSAENWLEGCALKRVAKSSEIIMFSDSAMVNGDEAVSSWYVSPPTYKNKLNTVATMHFRHQGKANIAWLDGHVDSRDFYVSCSESYEKYKIGWFHIDGLPGCASGTDARSNRYWKPVKTNK
jgi:prepilin-type processing-associated H-X9-DG protein